MRNEEELVEAFTVSLLEYLFYYTRVRPEYHRDLMVDSFDEDL